MHLVHVHTVPGSPPPLPPIVRPLNYPPIDCARIYSICNTTGVCGTAGADLQLHPMDDASRTDRQRDRQMDRLRDRSPTTTTRGTRFRGCHAVAGENLHLRTLSCSERAIGSRRNSFRLQVEVSMCRLQVAGCRCRTAGRRARGVVERRACIPGVSLSLGPRTPFPVQSLLPPSSRMAQSRL